MAKKTTKKSAKKIAKKAARKTTTNAGANKTVATTASVRGYLASLPPDRRADCEKLAAIMESVVKEAPKMWGPSIVGFGSYHYVYESGREGDMCLTGFSSRSNAITAYIAGGFEGQAELMARLGTYKTGKACLYMKSLANVDQKVLKELIKRSVRHVKTLYPG
tara:strand:- start:1296 stop:1784 length:489 start_codon:yes stop_codon:yes gene_type:complete